MPPRRKRRRRFGAPNLTGQDLDFLRWETGSGSGESRTVVPGYGDARKPRPDIRNTPRPPGPRGPVGVSSSPSPSRSAGPTGPVGTSSTQSLSEPNLASTGVDLLTNPFGTISDLLSGSEGGLENPTPPILGEPSIGELLEAAQEDRLGLNRRGLITTPRTRRVSRELARARQGLAASGLDLSGLSPAERDVARYARKANRKYPDIPTSLLMSLTRQESGFQADAVSSADAQGLTQFIPSTAEAYNVQYGTGPREKQSQLTGAAKLLSDNDFATDPYGALRNYTGGYSDEMYNDPVLQGADDYAALDRPAVSPAARQRYRHAAGRARRLGINPRPRRGPQGGGGQPQLVSNEPGQIPSAVWFGKRARDRFGLDVGENPYFGGVGAGHTEGSHHFQEYAPGRGEAIDVTGDPEKLAEFNQWAARKFGDGLTELFYDPGVNIADGTETGPIGGHDTHVHLAVDEPGSYFGGGIQGTVPAGFGSTGASLIAAGAPEGLVGQAVAESEPAPPPMQLANIAPPISPDVPMPEGFREIDSYGAPGGEEGDDDLLELLTAAYGLPGTMRRRRRL